MPKDNYKTEQELGKLWVDTLREHGRDNESKKEICNFFATIFGLDRREQLEQKSALKIGMEIEYYSYGHGKKWYKAIIEELDLEENKEWVYNIKTRESKLEICNANPVRYKKIILRIPELSNSRRVLWDYNWWYYNFREGRIRF